MFAALGSGRSRPWPVARQSTQEWDSFRPPTDRHRTSRPAPSPARTRTRTVCFHERTRRSDVRSCLSPDGDAAWAGRQDAVRNPSPHVAAFNGVQAGQSGRGYSVAATLSRPQEHPAYRQIQRAFAGSVSRFLEGLGKRLADTRWPSFRNVTVSSATFYSSGTLERWRRPLADGKADR